MLTWKKSVIEFRKYKLDFTREGRFIFQAKMTTLPPAKTSPSNPSRARLATWPLLNIGIAKYWNLGPRCKTDSLHQHRHSIMVARFVTTIATVTKLDTYVALGDLYFETKSWCHMITGLTTRGH